MLRLKKRSLNWALKHALRLGDKDVFPAPFEFEAIKSDWAAIGKFLLNEDIHNWKTRPPHSLLSPKLEHANVSPPAECTFKGEGFMSTQRLANFIQ